jgi:cystathionine gamma-synthase/cystathionine gamma-lyase/cystathionine beta-lyase
MKAAGSIETVAVHGGERRPGPEGSVVFPIYQGTVFEVEEGTDYHDIRYIRLNSTPSQRYLHDKLAALEGAEAALAMSSGMAALTTTLLTLLRRGDHVIASDCLYGGSHDFLTHHADELGWEVSFVNAQDPGGWASAVRPTTRVFLVETISNPLMRVPRLEEVVRFAREAGIVSLIDNTFASPVGFNPLSNGFDLCFHSGTKYLNGHSDLVAGCVMGKAVLVDRIRKTLNHYGAALDPHAGFLLARGIKTLALRVRAQSHNAQALAELLSAQGKVSAVNYPGLPSHPDHAHARELLSGFGGMLSFRLEGGVEAADRVMRALRWPALAPSLGGVESLVTLPARTSHAGMDPEVRRRMGVADDLVRVSCGIEATSDLLQDFEQALQQA